MARVLLVEDHELVHRMLCDAIVAAGHTADCVRTRAETLAAIATRGYELLVCDLVLPDGSGHDLVMAAGQYGMKILLMTGHPDEAKALRAQGIPCLLKPFRLEEFKDAMARHLS